LWYHRLSNLVHVLVNIPQTGIKRSA